MDAIEKLRMKLREDWRTNRAAPRYISRSATARPAAVQRSQAPGVGSSVLGRTSVLGRAGALAYPMPSSYPPLARPTPPTQQALAQVRRPEQPARVTLQPRDIMPIPLADSKREQLLKALRLDQVELALLCVPSGYIDARTAYVRTSAVPDGKRAIFLLRSSGRMRVYDKNGQELSCEPYDNWHEAPWRGYWSRFRRASIEFFDQDDQRLYCTVFSPAQAKELSRAGEHLITAELATFRARSIQKPQGLPLAAIGRIYASYASPGSNTSNEGVRALIREALARPDAVQQCETYLCDQTLMSPQELLSIVHSVPGCEHVESLSSFLLHLHNPRSVAEGEALRAGARRLAVVGLVHAARIRAWRAPNPAARIDLPHDSIKAIIHQLPMELTRDQSNAIAAICDALRDPTPMNALLCGDVGSGKTLAFAIPAVAAHLQGARVAIIAPTEILADQLANKLGELFAQAKVQRVHAGARSFDPQAILVGTIGLASVAQKLGYQPHLLIADEQHKMAVTARRAMAAEFTHLLEVSATPIPQAFASTLYAGVRLITLRQAPVKRQISSIIAGPEQRTDISRQLRSVIASGARAAIIYPRVNSQENASVLRAAADLEAIFPGQVACLNAKMKDEQIQAELAAFRSGDKPLLVASTIVETGIDVPDIRLLIVREADRFGVAQLHQLRGRLARNGGEGTFVMWTDDPDELQEDTRARLEALARLNDGFALADEDMKIRGFGDLLGDQQNGAISLPMRMIRLGAEDVEAELMSYEGNQSRDIELAVPAG